MSPTKQKILLLLLGGLAFGYSYTPQRQWRVLKQISYEWKRINKEKLRKEINQLYQTRLIRRKENSDGSITMELTERGRMKALIYRFDKMNIKPEKWDKKWRLVVFDIPEKLKSGRDSLRKKIKELGFYELQKSVWIYPYECENEIDFIIEFFNLRKYVRFATIDFIDNELHLKNIFKLVY